MAGNVSALIQVNKEDDKYIIIDLSNSEVYMKLDHDEMIALGDYIMKKVK